MAGLGANLGDRAAHLASAVYLVVQKSDCRLESLSSLYGSVPVGVTAQPNFINAVFCGRSSLHPPELLLLFKAVERILGRRTRPHWHAREIDIDLLMCGEHGEAVVDTPWIRVPHQQLANRRFVLEPLAEVAPKARHPMLDRSIEELLAHCPEYPPVWYKGPFPRIGELRTC
jgi:2-amino-4-hydroxy-6-hydroxymethyldihydropteridine diphosphokinase